MQLDKICRACLNESDNMSDMSLGDVLQKFLSFTNQKELENVSSSICKPCEEKLKISLDFQEQCQKSHEILLNHIIKQAADVDSEQVNDRQLERFPQGEVSEAIEAVKNGFYKNTECIRCGFTTSNARSLSIHVGLVHSDLKARWCGACNEEFEDLPSHSEAFHSNDVTCKLCGKKFRSKGHLTVHLRSHSGLDERPFKCTFCSKCFVTKGHLRVHLRKHTKEKPYQCHLCAKAFTQLALLKMHLKIHASSAKNEEVVAVQNYCTKCDKKVRSLVTHMEAFHSGTSGELCTICGKQFKTNSKLKVHMRTHTGEAPYQCRTCDKRVKTRNQLVVHERTHTGEKPHICHVCGKNFAQSSVLITHMRLHTGPTVTCKLCDQGFCRPAQLQLHLRRHTGEKPYICSECGQAFIQRSHLVEHNKTHSDLRPHHCTYCDKSFKQSSSLKSHIRIHSGEKPYKCNQCSYACRQSYSLTLHMKQHSSDKPRTDRPYQCRMCSKTFSTSAMLSSHLSYTHNAVFADN